MSLTNIASNLINSIAKSNKSTITGRAIGSIVFDVTLTENHTSNLRICENPIESGSVIADHAVLEPAELSVTGVVVDYTPPFNPFGSPLSILLRAGTAFLDSVSTPIDMQNKTAEAKRIAQDVLSAFSIESLLPDNVREIAPWLPDFISSFLGGDFTESNKRTAQVFADLLKCQKSGEPITVQTGLKSYTDMLIVSISVPDDKDGSDEFTVDLRQIQIVSTDMVAGVQTPKTTSPKPGGRSGKKGGSQGSGKTNKGKTNPKKEKDTTVLGDIFGSA